MEIDPDPFAWLLVIRLNHQPDIALLLILLVLVILLIFSGLLSGSEVAFFSLKKDQLKNKAKDKLITKLLFKPKYLLASILLSNNLVNIAFVILSTLSLHHYLDLGTNKALTFLIEVVGVSFFLVLFGELIPKIYANQNNYRFASFLAKPLDFLVRITYPFSKILANGSDLIEKRIKKRYQDLSAQDIKDVIDLTSSDATDKQEKNILKRIVNFGNVYVRQIMTSRVDVLAFDSKMSFSQIQKEITENHFSRVPVYEESPDKIIGVLYIKDLLAHYNKNDDFNWNKLLRKPYFIPENKKIDDLLGEFQEKKVHLAVVVDEYGGFSGIVTLEDVLEEIVGEISDEFDDESEENFRKLPSGKYIFNARTPLTDFVKILDLSDDVFEEIRGEAESLGGLIIETLGRIPKKGEKIKIQNIDFEIFKANTKRVSEILVNRDEKT